jgi:hypothetical protein
VHSLSDEILRPDHAVLTKTLTLEVGSALHYKAPELLLAKEDYDEKCDVWAAGCTVAEMVLGDVMFRPSQQRSGRSRATSFAEAEASRQLECICGICGDPSQRTWPGHSDLPLWRNIRTPKIRARPPKLQSYLTEHGVDARVLPLLEGALILNPSQRRSAADMIQDNAAHGAAGYATLPSRDPPSERRAVAPCAPLTLSSFMFLDDGGSSSMVAAQLPVHPGVLVTSFVDTCKENGIPLIVAVVAAVYFARACGGGGARAVSATVQLPPLGCANRARAFVTIAHACLWLAARLTLLSLRRYRFEIQACHLLEDLASAAANHCQQLVDPAAAASQPMDAQLASIAEELRLAAVRDSQEYYDLQSEAIERERQLLTSVDLRRAEQDEIVARQALGIHVSDGLHEDGD